MTNKKEYVWKNGKFIPVDGIYPTFYQTLVHSPQWEAWVKQNEINPKWDVHESMEIDALSPEHLQAFLKWCVALVALDKKIIGYLPFDNVKGTMHLNEAKLTALTFEKLWKD